MLISYNNVAYIKHDVAEAVRQKVKNNNVFIPSCIAAFKNVFSAIDNMD